MTKYFGNTEISNLNISLLGLAEPILQSSYTMTESTLINSTGNFFDSSIANSVLPDAVGPNKKTSGLFVLIVFIKRLGLFHQF